MRHWKKWKTTLEKEKRNEKRKDAETGLPQSALLVHRNRNGAVLPANSQSYHSHSIGLWKKGSEK